MACFRRWRWGPWASRPARVDISELWVERSCLRENVKVKILNINPGKPCWARGHTCWCVHTQAHMHSTHSCTHAQHTHTYMHSTCSCTHAQHTLIHTCTAHTYAQHTYIKMEKEPFFYICLLSLSLFQVMLTSPCVPLLRCLSSSH